MILDLRRILLSDLIDESHRKLNITIILCLSCYCEVIVSIKIHFLLYKLIMNIIQIQYANLQIFYIKDDIGCHIIVIYYPRQ